MNHPSYLELDAAVAAGHELPAHVAECERCRSHVESLRQAPPVPAWARELRRERTRWWVLLPLAAAATAAVLLFSTSEPYVGSKGGPAVAVILKHEDSIAPWDGKTPIHPGDQLRLRIAAAGAGSQVTVASLGPGGPVRLYQGSVAGEAPSLLPPAWTVDAEPGAERLLVILSSAPVDDPALLAAARNGSLGGAWVTVLALPKEGP